MKGTIYKINHHRGMVAVLTENGDFSVFELLGDDPVEEGDEIYWKNDTGLGGEIIKNTTQNEEYEVYFQNHWVLKNQLKQQLLY
ncbi:MAG: hypothetical protein V2B20_10490 [Pseudomonadota bacterium]